MIIAIFAKSREEYEQLEEWTRQYGDQYGERLAGRWFTNMMDYNLNARWEEFLICILALDDIENQEMAVRVRDFSNRSQFIWIGEDKRFALSSLRLQTANFLMKPAKQEDIDLSLKRCFERLGRPLERTKVAHVL